MILRIAGKEWLELVRDGRFRWTSLIILTLLIGATAVGWQSWREQHRERLDAQAEARARFDAQPEKNPHAAAHYGLWLFKPKQPLAFLDPGIDPYTGVAVFLEAHQRNPLEHRPAQDGTALRRFGDLTAAMILQQLMPLLVIILAFPAIAGERERGTLRQVLSLGVAPGTLMAGKAIGLTFALGVVLIPTFGLGAVLLIGSGADAMASWPSALVMAVSYLTYLGLFLAMSLYVSARAGSSRVALIVLMAFWIVNVLIVPRLTTDLGRLAVPTPSALEFREAIRRDIAMGIDGHDPQDQRLERLEQELLERYQVDYLEDLPINFQGVALQAGEESTNQILDVHYGDLYRRFEQQNEIREWLGLLSPTLAIRELSMALAGTDEAHHHDFAQAAEAYRRTLVKELNNDLEINGADLGFMYQAGPELWASVPPFHYDPPSLSETLSDHMRPCLGLVIWVVVLLGLLIRAGSSLRAI